MNMVRIVTVAVLALLAQSAMARESLVLTGAEVSTTDSSYAFAGIVIPLRQLGNGWHGRLWLDHIRYRYEGGGDTVQASSPGGHVAAGYQQSDASGGWSLFAGYSHHNTLLDPDQPGADNAGVQSSMLLSGELRQNSGARWQFSEAAVYEFAPESWWGRVKVSYGENQSIRHGVYLAGMGGPDYEIYKLGYSADGFSLGRGLSANLGFGFASNPGVEDFPFVTAELVWLSR